MVSFLMYRFLEVYIFFSDCPRNPSSSHFQHLPKSSSSSYSVFCLFLRAPDSPINNSPSSPSYSSVFFFPHRLSFVFYFLPWTKLTHSFTSIFLLILSLFLRLQIYTSHLSCRPFLSLSSLIGSFSLLFSALDCQSILQAITPPLFLIHLPLFHHLVFSSSYWSVN